MTTPDDGQLPPPASQTVDLAEYATEHGLSPLGLRPSLGEYIKQLWQRRHFTWSFARANQLAANSHSRFGQVWQVLNPLLSAAVFYVAFGIGLKTGDGVPNFISFLVIGVFFFQFIRGSVSSGSKSISSNLGLIRALYFPRALLPISVVLQQVLKFLPGIIILFILVLVTGETPSLRWLLLPVLLLIQALFSVGLAFIFSRLVSQSPDINLLLPFGLQAWFYMSGIFFSIQNMVQSAPPWLAFVVEQNPAGIFLTVARSLLLESATATLTQWITLVCWGVGAALIGFVWFWRAEATYGRG